MKKASLIIVMLAIMLSAFSQKNYSRPDIFTQSEITWYGLDFSNIKLINPEGFTDPDVIKSNQFWSLNNLILNEPDKYDLKKFFNKQTVNVDLGVIRERNKLPVVDELVLPAGSSYSFGEDKVKEIISEYEPEAAEGIGLVFIYENFNKDKETGTMWVTFFDIASKNVILADELTGKAGGFGFRNYWAKTYFNVMNEIYKKTYKDWERGK